jgi:hypothetical protein
MHKVVHIYPEYHSLCPHVGIRTPPPTVSVSPLWKQRGGGTDWPVGEGAW